LPQHFHNIECSIVNGSRNALEGCRADPEAAALAGSTRRGAAGGRGCRSGPVVLPLGSSRARPPGTVALPGALLTRDTRGSFVPEVDGLRFVAIAAVFAFHLALDLASRNPADFAYPVPGSALHDTLRTGELGVQLFFVLSGLVLALPFARHHLRGGPKVGPEAHFLRSARPPLASPPGGLGPCAPEPYAEPRPDVPHGVRKPAGL